MTAANGPWANPEFRLCNCFLLLAVALAGIAHIAFLPPFEGFDEPGHFSYIQQLADTGRIAQLGIDKLSADLDTYPGPLPYRTRYPPYDDNGAKTYKSFFAGTPPGSFGPVDHAYRPSERFNYEAQHPPLYYLALSPVYLLAKGWSWPHLFLSLRLASWGMAFAGFVVSCRATQCALARLEIAPASILLVAAWPFLFPEFFPEMARLGNDSLCLLLMGISWKLLLDLLARRDTKTALLLGLVLGLGLLTKAFFLPITAGCGAFLLFCAFRERDPRQARNAAIALLLAAGLGGGWYVYKFVSLGSLTGAADILRATSQGNLLLRIENNFGSYAFFRGLAGIFASFAWAGTSSLTRLPDIFTLPVVLLFLLPMFDWLLKLRRASEVAMAPLFIAGFMFVGMVYYLVTQITVTPLGPGAAGWYFHILYGPLALAFVIGWRRPPILKVLAAYAIVFHAVCWAGQLSLFSGCAYKAGSYKYIQFDFGSCFIEPARLAVLGEPLLGALALAAAILAGGAALLLVGRERRQAVQAIDRFGGRSGD